jgi:hypothetical protein
VTAEYCLGAPFASGCMLLKGDAIEGVIGFAMKVTAYAQ